MLLIKLEFEEDIIFEVQFYENGLDEFFLIGKHPNDVL
jgi:hypothetical protein